MLFTILETRLANFDGENRQRARDGGALSRASLMVLASLTLCIHTTYVRRSEGIVRCVYRNYVYTATRAYCSFPKHHPL